MPDDHNEAFWAETRAVYEQRERAADELLATVKARLPELHELAEHMDRGAPVPPRLRTGRSCWNGSGSCRLE